MLLPLDIVVAVKLATLKEDPTYAQLAHSLGISASQAHAAVGRCVASQLVHADSKRVIKASLMEFLEHGVRYMLPGKLGPEARGVATSFSAAPLNEEIDAQEIIVWPHPEGELRGASLEPIYKIVPDVARNDPQFHSMMAMIDAIRMGRARERSLAKTILMAVLYDSW